MLDADLSTGFPDRQTKKRPTMVAVHMSGARTYTMKLFNSF